MSEIEWTEPPAHGGTGRRTPGGWAPIADAMRANPGQWAKLKTATSDFSLATRIKRGTVLAFAPAGEFEAITRNTRLADGRRVADIYARFVGGGAR